MQKKKTLTALLTEEGRNVTDGKGILEIARQFYAILYKGQEDQLASIQEVGEELRDLDLCRLSEEDKEARQTILGGGSQRGSGQVKRQQSTRV